MIGARAEHHDRLADLGQRRADEPHQLRQLRDRRDRRAPVPVLVLPRLRDVVRDPLPVAEDAPTDGDGEQPRVEHVWVRERDPVDVVRPRGDDREHDRGATGLAERDHGPAPFAEGGEPAGGLVHPSVQCRVRRSSMSVPWPGRRTPSTERPCAASHSPIGRIEAGEPVRPWTMRTPTGPPPSENGSQPGRICGLLTRSEGSLATSGVHEQREDHVEERETDRPGQADQREHEEPLEQSPRREHGAMLPVRPGRGSRRGPTRPRRRGTARRPRTGR